MKKIIILIVAVLLTALLSNTAMSQSFSGIQWDWYDISGRTAVATGNKNIVPDSCAALQIGKDTTRYGLLLPRVVDTVIAGQKKGLLTYRLKDNNIYYHNGVKWMPVGGCCESSSNFSYDTLAIYATWDMVYDFYLLWKNIVVNVSDSAGTPANSNPWKWVSKYYADTHYEKIGNRDYVYGVKDIALTTISNNFIFKTDISKGRFIVIRFVVTITAFSGGTGTPNLNIGWTSPSYNDLVASQAINNTDYGIVGRVYNNLANSIPILSIPTGTDVYFRVTNPGAGTWKCNAFIEGFYEND